MLRNNRMKGFLQRKAMIRMLAGVCSLAVLMNTLLPVTAASEGATFEATMAKEENIAIADNLTYAEYHSGSSIEVVEEIDFSKYQVVEIVTEEDLKELAERCRLDSWSTDKYVTLKQDIVLEQYGDVSIPSFGGVFEGNGHKISGLYIQQEGSEWGLFRVLRKGGMIQNLSVAGIVSPQGSQEQVGGIVGSNYGTILKCTFTGKVKGSREVGGIAGYNGESGSIRQSISFAGVVGDHSTGGIAGYNIGIINGCENKGGVNTYNVEVSYDLENLSLENWEDINSTANVAVHTDTGGIAGLSEGKIYSSTNSGSIGYPHVGYNVGGIAGRLSQGYVQDCTNKGTVLGRKDAGGIVGQLEPFLEVEYIAGKFQQLDEEMNYMLELLEQLYESNRGDAKEIAKQGKVLAQYLQNVSASLRNVSSISRSMWYLYNQELTGAVSDYERLHGQLEENLTQAESTEEANEEDQGLLELVPTVSGNDWQEILPSVSGGDLILPEYPDVELPETPDWGTIVPDNTDAILAALQKFGDSTVDRMNRVNQTSKQNMEQITANLDNLEKEMAAAEKQLDTLLQAGENTAERADASVEAILHQAQVLKDLTGSIRDDLFAYEGADISDDSMNYDTTSFQKGKITLSRNLGAVEADTNVGGIVGQIATEFDLDPEEDVTITGEKSFEMERTIKAVVRECSNKGTITAKKDYAGGIVGKADFGVVIACESYGQVSSASGSYVGGIAGCSGYAIRDCAFLGQVSGKNYVGGIVGLGCDIFHSYAMPDIVISGECGGSIAGNVKKEGILNSNFYVENAYGGVDGRSYENGAQPLSYAELQELQNLPQEFTLLTVTFVAEGKELDSLTCSYGESIGEEQLPDIPGKEGYYGYWETEELEYVTGNRRVEAVYEKWITSLSSQETDALGRAILAVEGEFLPETTLALVEKDEETTFAIETMGEEYTKEVRVHYLLEESQKEPLVEVMTQAGWQQVDTKRVGSYLLFDMEGAGSFRLKEAPQTDYGKWIICGGAVVVGMILLTICIRWSKAKRR